LPRTECSRCVLKKIAEIENVYSEVLKNEKYLVADLEDLRKRVMILIQQVKGG